MSEPQTRALSDPLVSSDDNMVEEENEEHIERELLGELNEPSPADMYLLLQEMHTDMRSFKSRLDRVEKGRSNDQSNDRSDDNEVVCDTELAPKHGGHKRKPSDEVSDDESVFMKKVLLNPVENSAENTSVKTDSLLSDIAQELSEQEPTGPVVNEDLAAMLNKRWATKMSDKKLSDKLELIQRPANCSGFIVPRVNPEIWSSFDKFNKRRDLRTSNVQTGADLGLVR